MTRSMWRRSRLAAFALAIPFVLVACGDDDDNGTGPDGDGFNGTYSYTEDGITSFVRITDDAIEIFEGSGICFIEAELAIESREDGVFEVDNGVDIVEWTFDEVGNNVVVEDDEGISRTLVPSNTNLTNLTMCEPYDPEVDDFARAPCSALPQLAVPGSVDGEIEQGDPRFYDLTWFDAYRIQIGATTDVNITMAADNPDDLDPYLSIYDSDGVEVTDDDDSAGGGDSRIQTTLDPGCYYVIAGAYSGDDEGETGGSYTLTATTELVSDFPHATCSAIPEIAIGGSVDGTLASGDTRWTDDSWYDLYSLQLDAEETVTITMEEDGSGIDTYMMLYNSLGTEEIDANDDIDFDNDNYNSQIIATLEPGCYIIVANSYEGDDEGEVGGAYTLSVD